MAIRFRKDVTAVLISGNEKYYFSQLKKVGDYLIEEARVRPSSVHLLSGRVNSNSEVLEQVDAIAHEIRQGTAPYPLVLFYHGHGLRTGMCIDGQVSSYEALADTLGFDLPFLFVNNACYSGTALHVFHERGILPRFGSIIASAQPYQGSFGTVFLDALLDSLREKKPFRRKKLYAYAGSNPYASLHSDFHSQVVGEYYVQKPTRLGYSIDHLLYPHFSR